MLVSLFILLSVRCFGSLWTLWCRQRISTTTVMLFVLSCHSSERNNEKNNKSGPSVSQYLLYAYGAEQSVGLRSFLFWTPFHTLHCRRGNWEPDVVSPNIKAPGIDWHIARTHLANHLFLIFAVGVLYINVLSYCCIIRNC